MERASRVMGRAWRFRDRAGDYVVVRRASDLAPAEREVVRGFEGALRLRLDLSDTLVQAAVRDMLESGLLMGSLEMRTPSARDLEHLARQLERALATGRLVIVAERAPRSRDAADSSARPSHVEWGNEPVTAPRRVARR